ncbi:hypothetical protein IGI04_040089, partial [Brassica rapa subsp. trilocularis]
YEDIFTNTLFINDQKTILALTLSLSHDPLLFRSLSLSLAIFFLPLCLRFTGHPPSLSHFTGAVLWQKMFRLSISDFECLMDLETENRIASVLLREAAELRRQAEKDGVRAYLEKPNVRHRPNSRFLTTTVLANSAVETNEMGKARELENERLKRKSREESSRSSSQMKRSSSFSKRSLDVAPLMMRERSLINHHRTKDCTWMMMMKV